jgi:hypothetical protein
MWGLRCDDTHAISEYNFVLLRSSAFHILLNMCPTRKRRTVYALLNKAHSNRDPT